MRKTLQDLTGSLARSFAFVSVAVSIGKAREIATFGAQDPIFRVASITKYVTGLVMQRVMRDAGVSAPYQIDVSDVLGYPVHPDGNSVTMGMLASHTAGLIDAIVPTDTTLQQFVTETPSLFHSAPGEAFQYSNPGYVVLAAGLECIAGKRFDHLVTEELGKHGIIGGLNWSGVHADQRARSLATMRRVGDSFDAQIDEAVPKYGVMLANGRVADVTNYMLGENPAVFAPHGGLRTDMDGLLRLAETLRNANMHPLWFEADGPGAYLDGLMQDYGAGLQILPEPTFYPRPLIGHFANAYGFNGGIWFDRETDVAFAYALNGRPMGEETDELTAPERQVFDCVAGLP